jgi:adenylate cyclase
MAHLEILEGFDSGKMVSFGNEVVVGRSPDNTLCLPDHRVSRQHARITRRGTHFVIEDLHSTNGVFVRGVRIPPGVPCDVHDGDEIRIGSTRLVFHANATGSGQQPTSNGSKPSSGATTIPSGEVFFEGNGGTLSLTMLKDERPQPRVAVALDASANMTEVDDDERQTDKGLQDALKRLQAICQVSTALGAITDRKKLLQRILDCVFDIFPTADRSFIMLYDKNRNVLLPAVAKQRHETPGQRQEIAISRTIIKEVIAHKRSILSYDAMGDERFHEHSSIINLSIRSMMCAPLLIGQEILGLIQVDTCTGTRIFTSEDLQILTGISAQAAIAVKNTQLYEAIETETARRTSLQRYFSPGLVEMLISGDITTELGGSAYQGTVLFSDIIGFTAMSESLSPTEVVARLNRYFRIMQKLIYDNGGNVDKFSGDAIMAFWGVPRAGQHDEYDAVLTALQMQEKLWSFNLALKSEGQQPIHMGVGLNTGEFVAGNIGSEDKIEFTLIGDTVNLAARIEELAGRSQVLVSETTWFPIKDRVCAVQLPPVTLKGKSKPVTIYSIRAIQDGSHDGCILALPCHLSTPAGCDIGRGIITGSKGSGATLQLFLHTDISSIPGDVLIIRLVLAEYHQPLCFPATVASCSTAAHEENVVYTKIVLTAINDEAALAFFTPGSCLVTAYSWNDMGRA